MKQVFNPFRDQEKFMRACDQSVTGDDAQYKMYRDLIDINYQVNVPESVKLVSKEVAYFKFSIYC